MAKKKWTHISDCQLCVVGIVLKSNRGRKDIENAVKYLNKFTQARFWQIKKKSVI